MHLLLPSLNYLCSGRMQHTGAASRLHIQAGHEKAGCGIDGLQYAVNATSVKHAGLP
jgi:hypothetical protein